MHTSRKTKILTTLGALAVAGLVASFVSTGVARADVPESDGTLHLCYQSNIPNNGTNLKLIDPDHGGVCGSGTSEVTVNQTGPQGPAGATGPQGPAGSSGPNDSGLITYSGFAPSGTCSVSDLTGPNASTISVTFDNTLNACVVSGLSSGEDVTLVAVNSSPSQAIAVVLPGDYSGGAIPAGEAAVKNVSVGSASGDSVGSAMFTANPAG